MYNNHLLFFAQVYRLEKHIVKLAPVYENGKLPRKASFCTLQPYSKVWAHRVNTFERFLFLSKQFNGFEIDIVFNEHGRFLDIRHPPASSINLSFEKYLQAAESKNKYFWLDVKNLTNGNGDAILSCLAALDNKYSIRNRTIIESDNIVQLGKISDAGYFTSYYYSLDSYRNFMSSGTDASHDTIFNKIDAVSQDVSYYDTLAGKFPDKPRLTWALSIKNYWSDSVLNSLDTDKALLVYLVNIKSPHHR